MGIEFSDNISIATSNEEEDTCIAEKYQNIHSTKEMDIETFLQQIRNQIEESSSSGMVKGKKTIKEQMIRH